MISKRFLRNHFKTPLYPQKPPQNPPYTNGIPPGGGSFYSTRKTNFIATFPGNFAPRFNPPHPGGYPPLPPPGGGAVIRSKDRLEVLGEGIL